MPETEKQKSPEPDDQADDHENNEDMPYLRLSDDDPLMFTTDLD